MNKEELKKHIEKFAEDFLKNKIYNKNEGVLFYESLEKTMLEALKNGIIEKDYSIKRTKLPRKLKKRYKKEKVICFECWYRKVVPTTVAMTIDLKET